MAEISYKKIGEILIEQGFISMEQLREALEEQKLTGEKVGEILVKKGVVGQEEIELALSKQKGIARFDLSNYIIEPSLFKLIPEDFARKYKLLPVFLIENTLTVAMADPTNVFIIDELQRLTKLMVEPVLAQELEIKKSQDQYYGGSGTLLEIVASIDRSKLSEGEKLGEEAPIIKIVNYLIMQAVQLKASDIHIEPEEKTLNIRYRVDGLLRRQSPLPKDLSGAVISRFKIMSGLDISEKRLPQDGRIIMKIGNKDIDFRVSTCPTIHGENVVLRILDKSGVVLGLETLGFPAKELGMFQEMIHSPYGIILVTGPTGSGKTTTLYSALQILNKETVNIMTVEDPVEYQFPGIRQVPVNVKTGLTFAAALRSFLRQDPNIIMLGEIRDHETAELAIQAALTGHQVFSTVHTNSASGAPPRLLDIEVEPFLLTSALNAIVGQRVVRKICIRCREEFSAAPEVDENIKSVLGNLIPISIKNSPTPMKLYKGKGCNFCANTGYLGRLGIFEVLVISESIAKLILEHSSSSSIEQEAVKRGMITLKQDGYLKVLEGVTTMEEVLRVA